MAQPAPGSATTPARATTLKKSKVAYCDYCDCSHAGPNEACWFAHLELRPKDWTDRRSESVKKVAAERENKNNNRTNVTISEDKAKTYGNHVFYTIANVSPAILKKAVKDKDY
jgi:hypothetical protein